MALLATACPDPQRARPLWGIADTHTHQFANLAFGGRLFWGKPFDPIGKPERALPACEYAHGENGDKDVVGSVLRNSFLGHRTAGYPRLTSWPAWNTIDHQQMYVDWLFRAYRAGLRLMVMHAVNSEGICSTPVVRKATGRSCSDMEAVDLQLQGARGLEAYLDNQAGGPGKGWYRIVTSAAQARQVVRDGKLAVILGIEVDNVFGCKITVRCSDDSVRKALTTYYHRGVRHIIPVHLANNAFGGFAIYDAFFAYNNYILNRAFPESFDCSSAGFDFHLDRPALPLQAILKLVGAGQMPIYPPGATCNSRGLTSLGKALVKEMMKRGMLLELDHMSYLSIRDAVDSAEKYDYPMISGHTGLLGPNMGQGRDEYQKTDSQLEIIRRSGGMISLLLNQGIPGRIRQWADPVTHDSVANNCPESTKTWAQAYLYAVNRMGGAGSAAIGMASDQSLFAWLGPRFGKAGCSQRGPGTQTDTLDYPITVHDEATGRDTSFMPSIAGTRVFDFNVDGFAHIGMLPDFLQDLKNIGVTEAQLSPLYHSAEAYISMWEKAERSGRVIP